MKFRTKILGTLAVMMVIFAIYGCDDLNLPIIDEDSCTSCRECLAACRYEAIHFENNKPVIDPVKCTVCGECALFCPQEAILMP